MTKKSTQLFDTGKRWANNLMAQYQSKVFPRWVQFLQMNKQECVSFARLEKAQVRDQLI